jgi:uncharacterized protein
MMIRKWLRSLEPRMLAEFDRPALAWLKSWLDQHDVFSFTREPLAKGIAFGLFCSLIPGPLQIIAAAILCVYFRGNVLAAATGTLLSNPLTIVPLYVVAFKIGAFLLPGSHVLPPWRGENGSDAFFTALINWIQAMGWPLVVGLPTLAFAIAITGYALTQIAWLTPVIRRAKRMARASRAT